VEYSKQLTKKVAFTSLVCLILAYFSKVFYLVDHSLLILKVILYSYLILKKMNERITES